MKKHKVFLVDDHSVVREGLTKLINQEKDLMVCGDAGDIASALRTIPDSSPDIIIVDLTLELENGLRLIENLMYGDKNLLILVLSMHDESIYAERCLRAGAKGYIMKQAPSEKMLSAIRKVLSGEIYVSDIVNSRLLNRFTQDKSESTDSPVDILSNRELEVYQLTGRGLKKGDIAEQLSLSVSTIATYTEHIKRKLNFKSLHELYLHAVKFVDET